MLELDKKIRWVNTRMKHWDIIKIKQRMKHWDNKEETRQMDALLIQLDVMKLLRM